MKNKKLQQLKLWMAITLLLANSLLFSQLGQGPLTAFSPMILFILNPIAVILAGRRAGLYQRYSNNIALFLGLLFCLYWMPAVWNTLLGDRFDLVKHLPEEFAAGTYLACLLVLFVVWIGLGAHTRQKAMFLIKQKLLQEELLGKIQELQNKSTAESETKIK